MDMLDSLRADAVHMVDNLPTPLPHPERRIPLALKIGAALFLFSFIPFVYTVLYLVYGYEAILDAMLNVIEKQGGLRDVNDVLNVWSDLHIGIWMLGAMLTILIASGIIIAIRGFVRPLHSILSYMRDIRTQKFEEPAALAVATSDEFDELSREINALVAYFRQVQGREKLISRAKTEFISIVAHQLRTPLTSIKWAISSVIAKEGDEKRRGHLLNIAQESTNRMIRLVNDLLDVTRIEEGRFGYSFRSTELESLLENVITEFVPLTQKRSINLQMISRGSLLPPVFIDPERVRLVLNNLLANAVTYTGPGGSIEVSAEHNTNTNYVLVFVRDSGMGIRKDDHPRIFSKFFRSSEAVRVQPNGSGLGLFIVRNIILQHGGAIWFESERGKGTTFFFTLPIREEDVKKKEVSFEDVFLKI